MLFLGCFSTRSENGLSKNAAFCTKKFFDCLRPKKTACNKAMLTRKAPETAVLAVFCGARGNTLSQNAAFCAKNGVLEKEFVNTILNGGIYEKTC